MKFNFIEAKAIYEYIMLEINHLNKVINSGSVTPQNIIDRCNYLTEKAMLLKQVLDKHCLKSIDRILVEEKIEEIRIKNNSKEN